MRQDIAPGGPWEEVAGYSRAVWVGKSFAVSGTTAALPDGSVCGGDDGYAQAYRAFETAVQALEATGARREDVICTPMFVTEIARREEFSRAQADFFRDAKPAAMVELRRLMTPEMLIEGEADAVVAGGT